MTKMKSKKMTKSTFAIIIMGIIMVAMLAFGGTFAYFTATSAGMESKTFTAGNVEITSNSSAIIETVRKDLKIVPGVTIMDSGEDGLVITNKSNVKTYVFITFEAAADKDYWVQGANEKAVVVDVTSTGWQQLGTSDIYYIEADAPTGASQDLAAFEFSVVFNNKVESNKADGEETSNVVIGKEGTTPVKVMGTLSVTVSLTIQSIQHEGFTATGTQGQDGYKTAVENAYAALNS